MSDFNQILDLVHFRAAVTDSLIMANKTINKKRGRPSSTPDLNNEPPKDKRQNNETRPQNYMRLDNIGHLPTYSEKQFGTRCKFPNCKGKSRIMCCKCGVHLCLTKTNNFL